MNATYVTAAAIAAVLGGAAANEVTPLLQTAAEPSFEVASVKPNKGDGPTESGTQPGGRVAMVNVPLRFLIRSAYQIQDDQIVDAPAWIASEHFDVLAKAANDFPPPTAGAPGPLPAMMRTLLAERFKLSVHRETREFPAYALRLARRDGRLGPSLHPSATDCVAAAAARARGAQPAPAPDGRPQCGVRAAGGRMMAGAIPLPQLAAWLSSTVQRVVLDRTGLTGNFDLELRWTPERTGQGTPPPATPPATADPDAPSIFTALQEQLGLRLESIRNPVEVLVIDHVERPTPD
jgi:uncharacterized protein (TIGR03435 family)